WLRLSSDLLGSIRAIPAAFQNTALASSATATNALPIPAARAPTSIFKNWPSNVPTFSKISAAPANPGSNTASPPRVTINLFTEASFIPTPGLANDDKPATLLTQIRVDNEHIDPAHHILTVSRNQVPPRLAIVRGVLLPIVSRPSLVVRPRDVSAHR